MISWITHQSSKYADVTVMNNSVYAAKYKKIFCWFYVRTIACVSVSKWLRFTLIHTVKKNKSNKFLKRRQYQNTKILFLNILKEKRGRCHVRYKSVFKTVPTLNGNSY